MGQLTSDTLLCGHFTATFEYLLKGYKRTNSIPWKTEKMKWENVETEVLDVRDLKTLQEKSFAHVLTNFGFRPTPEDLSGPGKAASEIWRVFAPGGMAVVTTCSEHSFDVALKKVALVVRPNEKLFSINVPNEWYKGWWLMKQLEEGGFGNKVQVKSVGGRVEAATLDELASNTMLLKDIYYKGYSEEELTKVEKGLKEEIRKLPEFEQTERDVGTKTVAWTGLAFRMSTLPLWEN